MLEMGKCSSFQRDGQMFKFSKWNTGSLKPSHAKWIPFLLGYQAIWEIKL